jgi:acetylglutamate kinase
MRESLMKATYLIKIGGHEIADIAFLNELAHAIKQMPQQVVIVHGGGKEISSLQKKLGIEPQYIDGVRVTDAQSLMIVQMVLAGLVNKRLVRQLLAVGLDAQGMTGVDRRLITAHKMPHATVDMGFTGEIDNVRAEVLGTMLQQNQLPVIAPLCYGEDAIYNVNADHVAGAIAIALNVERAIFLTNVEGVLVDGEVVTQMTPTKAEKYIADGIITGGMIPKVRTALQTLQTGVQSVAITNLQGLRTHGGTLFIADE